MMKYCFHNLKGQYFFFKKNIIYLGGGGSFSRMLFFLGWMGKYF